MNEDVITSDLNLQVDKKYEILLNIIMSTVTISLPNEIAKKVDSEAKNQGFATRSEFIRSLIRRYFTRDQFELEEFQPVSLNQLKMELAQTGKYSEEFINSIINGFERSSIYEK